MKFAILGGSFNPVHIGHLSLADAVLAGFDYDRIILVPAFQSPFKIGAETASPRDRMDMLAASVSGDPRLTVDNCEISREGVSYTVDTIEDIIARYSPEGKPGLILGDDLASTFYKWQKPERIAELADIIIARRLPEAGKTAPAEEYPCTEDITGDTSREERPFPYPHRTLNNEIINVSSRCVREKIRRSEDWRYLVPSGARYIIEGRCLYGYKGDSGLAETIVRMENEVRAILSPPRFIHSRNTALLAWDLCRRFGLDSQKGYLAGIVHDICKAMNEEELIRLAHADGGGSSKLEHQKPGLLHARAGAVLLERKYGINDKDILEAVRYHTTGKRDMNPIAKVVYIADKIEVSRPGVEAVLRGMSRSADLDTLFTAVVDNTVAYLISRQLDISYGTKRLLAAMNKRNSL